MRTCHLQYPHLPDRGWEGHPGPYGPGTRLEEWAGVALQAPLCSLHIWNGPDVSKGSSVQGKELL